MVFFPALIFICFFSYVLILTYVHSEWLYIERNDVLKKMKLPKLYICQKLAIGTPRGLLKVVESEILWCYFCALIDNFERVSRITVMCLLPTSCVYCKTFHSIQCCFYKTSIFHISWSFNSHCFIVLWLQLMCKILKATAR